jgi:hypothetical protein
MGIWIELGLFIVVLVWAVWQLHDVKKALARTRAEKARQAAGDTAGSTGREQP